MKYQETLKDFEKYLEGVCFEANPSVLDDDMPDFFDNWLSQQEGEDYIRYADNYRQDLMSGVVKKIETEKQSFKVSENIELRDAFNAGLTEAQTIIKTLTRV